MTGAGRGVTCLACRPFGRYPALRGGACLKACPSAEFLNTLGACEACDGTCAECDGADLHYEVWEPDGSVKGTLYHSHGVCESNETTNTQRLVQRAVARGWRVVCLEHEGHGLSSGARAVVSMDRCVQLFEAFVRARLGEGAWALSGASMGANVVLYASQRLSLIHI